MPTRQAAVLSVPVGVAPIGGSVLEALLAILLSERVGVDVTDPSAERSAAAIAVRDELTRRLAATGSGSNQAPTSPQAA